VKTITTLLKEIATNNGQFPKEILQSIIDRRDEFIPELLNILEDTCQNAAALADQHDYFAHIYALYLLAQFREKSAYPLACRLVSDPHVDDLLDDVITEGLPEILASLCAGEIELIKEVIENSQVDEFVRSAALKSLVILVAQGIKTRDEIMAYFASLFRGKLERDNSIVLSSLTEHSFQIYPEEVIKDIELAYREELIDPFYIEWPEIKQQLTNKKEDVLAELGNNRSFRLIDDTIAELEHWACFNENYDDLDTTDEEELFSFANELDFDDEPEHEISAPQQEPYRNTNKVGRNDPCPCGSGKKYKKCCGK